MNETPQTELTGKLQTNGVSPAKASYEVAQAMAMSPASGAEHLKQLGLDYLECFKLLSAVTVGEIQVERNQGDGLLAVLFPKRLTRGEYLLRYVFITVGFVLTVMGGAIAKMKGAPGSLVPAAFFILIIIYKIAVMDAARFRDRGKTGFFACVMIFPFVNLIVQFYLWFAK